MLKFDPFAMDKIIEALGIPPDLAKRVTGATLVLKPIEAPILTLDIILFEENIPAVLNGVLEYELVRKS